jgi:hypothetical protein
MMTDALIKARRPDTSCAPACYVGRLYSSAFVAAFVRCSTRSLEHTPLYFEFMYDRVTRNLILPELILENSDNYHSALRNNPEECFYNCFRLSMETTFVRNVVTHLPQDTALCVMLSYHSVRGVIFFKRF